MLTIRKAIESDTQVIYDLRKRAIVEKCSGSYSEEQLSLWTQGEVSEGFTQDVVSTFYCLLYTSPSPRDNPASRMPSSA